MSQRQPAWQMIESGSWVQLSAIDPPDARVPGPVVGPGSHVRPCGLGSGAAESRVICLDVKGDGGEIERGYTYPNFVRLRRDRRGGRWLAWLGGLGLAAGLAVALL